MLQQRSSLLPQEIEAGMRRAVQKHGAHLLAVSHVGQLLTEEEKGKAADTIVFTICQPRIYAALLAADMRFAALVPCRVAACPAPDGVTLLSLAPREFCHLLNRSDLERLTAPLEALLRDVMEELSQPQEPAAHAAHVPSPYSLGATEESISLRATLPQRIDRQGTKVEDLAGTGTHDSSGG